MNEAAGEFAPHPGAKLWGHMTVEEIREAILTTKTAIIPTGCTEQHGYHLPTSVDTITAYDVAVAAAGETGCFVLPPLHYTFSGGVLPGTIDLSPGLTEAVLVEIGEALYRHGARNIIFLHGHCGTENNDAHQMAARLLYRSAPEAHIAVVPIYKMSETWWAGVGEGDNHAGYIESSLMLHMRPDMVRDKSKWIVDTPDEEGFVEPVYTSENEYVVPLHRVKASHRIGVSGYPERSDPAIGKKVFDELVAGMVKLIRDVEV